MGLIKEKKATAGTPQVVTLVIDDSESMSWGPEPRNKARQATEAVQDLVIQMQGWSQSSSGFRYLLNIARFGDMVTPLVEAEPPGGVELNTLEFNGESGTTQMAKALKWAADVVTRSLEKCRQVPRYDESISPNPLVIFFSDGENYDDTDAITAAAGELKAVEFQGGRVDVVAIGIGVEEQHLKLMEAIASEPLLARNIDPDKLGNFIAEAAQTIEKSESPVQLVEQFDT